MQAHPTAPSPAARAAVMRAIDAHRELRMAVQDVAAHGDAQQQQAARELLALCESLWRPIATLGASV